MRVALLAVLAIVASTALAQPGYFYEEGYYDYMYDDYDLAAAHYNMYDFFQEDYAAWDDFDDMPHFGDDVKAGSSSSSGSKTPSSKDWSDWDEDYYSHPYFSYYDDIYGDYFFDDPFEFESDCVLDENKQPKFEGIQACDIVLEGADKVAELMGGGIDGTYKAFSCENGRPFYKRENSPAGEERVLWYSSTFRDWDLTNGTMVNEDDILMYGGQGDSELRPQFVPGQWHIASDLIKGYDGLEDYVAFDLSIKCADGSVVEKPEKGAPTSSDGWGSRPFLTDDEMEAQYSMVYKRAQQRADANEVSLGLVSLFVFVGLAIVFGLPFMVARTRRNRRGPPRTSTGRKEGGFNIASIMLPGKKAEHTK